MRKTCQSISKFPCRDSPSAAGVLVAHAKRAGPLAGAQFAGGDPRIDAEGALDRLVQITHRAQGVVVSQRDVVRRP